jgi:hypothetical protein
MLCVQANPGIAYLLDVDGEEKEVVTKFFFTKEIIYFMLFFLTLGDLLWIFPRNYFSFFYMSNHPRSCQGCVTLSCKQECKQSNFLLRSCYLAMIVVHEIDGFFVLC